MNAWRQLALPFVYAPQFAGADFLAAASNAEALAWLRQPQAWPQGRLALWGGEGCGKTHLLHVWAERRAGTLLDGPALAAVGLAPPDRPLAVDDADAAAERPLLHLLNAAAEAGQPVLLAAREPPGRWAVALPDLASRLRAVLAVQIRPAEETLLRTLLARLLADRQLHVPETLQEWLLARLPRTQAALREAAARLDHAALAAGGVSRSLAARVLAEMGTQPAEADPTKCDRIVKSTARGGAAEPPLL
jgi:chromosomal replication initiation ATPase DnaA